MFSMLFLTVACGAVSGFHALISSGTSSKQIRKESDTKIIGYGASSGSRHSAVHCHDPC
ncbi:MAG: hypothetical protein GX846_05475 [Deltaproteobacteria bacterium]|nr:hypothetical protein [Deltaproteobacteria bacterium]